MHAVGVGGGIRRSLFHFRVLLPVNQENCLSNCNKLGNNIPYHKLLSISIQGYTEDPVFLSAQIAHLHFYMYIRWMVI